MVPNSGYARAQAMISQWPNLGIIEPANPPQGYAGAFHVEMAPLDQPKDDPTVALIAAVEKLDERSKAVATKLTAEAPSPAERKFKPARIHYRRGEV